MDNNNPPNRAAGTHGKYRDLITDPSWTAGGEKDMAQLMGFIGRGGGSRAGAQMDHTYNYSDVDPETGLGAQVHAEDCPACKAVHEASKPYGETDHTHKWAIGIPGVPDGAQGCIGCGEMRDTPATPPVKRSKPEGPYYGSPA